MTSVLQQSVANGSDDEGKATVPQFDSDKLHVAVKFVYEGLEQSNVKNSIFSLADCRAVRDSRVLLDRSIDDIKVGKLVSLGKDVNEAYQIFRRAADAQQACKPAFFSIDGAIAMLENLEMIENWVKENRSAADKLAEAKAQKKAERTRGGK